MAHTSRVHDRRRCERCGGDLPDGSSVNRRFCPRCGHARRGLTFLQQAIAEIDLAGDQTTVGELEVIAGRVERAS